MLDRDADQKYAGAEVFVSGHRQHKPASRAAHLQVPLGPSLSRNLVEGASRPLGKIVAAASSLLNKRQPGPSFKAGPLILGTLGSLPVWPGGVVVWSNAGQGSDCRDVAGEE